MNRRSKISGLVIALGLLSPLFHHENGAVRNPAVQNNCVRVRFPLPNLAGDKHTFKIQAVDPAAVIDRVSLP